MKQKPAHQQKDRYMRFEIHSRSNHEFKQVLDEIKDKQIKYNGEATMAEANIWVIKNKYNENDSKGIIRYNKGYESNIRAGLTQISNINGEECFIEVSGTSGMINKL